MECPICNSPANKAGKALRRGGKVQQWKCTKCGHTFTEKSAGRKEQNTEQQTTSIKKDFLEDGLRL